MNIVTLNDKIYNILKPLAIVYLPALATLYFAIAAIWHIPETQNVVGTITAINTCLGGFLGLSARNYETPADGALIVSGNDLKSVKIPLTPEEVVAKNLITLKVQSEKSESQSSGKPSLLNPMT